MNSFFENIELRLKEYENDLVLLDKVREFQNLTIEKGYTYNFTWLGVPMLQLPQDLYLLQEVFWEVKPNVVIETGIAHGGSLIYTASLLRILEDCGFLDNPLAIGIDIEIRQANRVAIDNHPLRRYIKTFEGSSTDLSIVSEVRRYCDQGKRVLVILDSNHTAEHVYNELISYSPLVSQGSYILVADTGIEFTPANLIGDRPWGPGNSPLTAVNRFLAESSDFKLDNTLPNKVWLTAYFQGVLKKVDKI